MGTNDTAIQPGCTAIVTTKQTGEATSTIVTPAAATALKQGWVSNT